MKSYERALEQRGYTVLISVGFGQRPDGTWSIKLAASPALRGFSQETWQSVRDTIVGALDRMYETPLDDLEME